jgi:hypothetical protein
LIFPYAQSRVGGFFQVSNLSDDPDLGNFFSSSDLFFLVFMT